MIKMKFIVGEIYTLLEILGRKNVVEGFENQISQACSKRYG